MAEFKVSRALPERPGMGESFLFHRTQCDLEVRLSDMMGEPERGQPSNFPISITDAMQSRSILVRSICDAAEQVITL